MPRDNDEKIIVEFYDLGDGLLMTAPRTVVDDELGKKEKVVLLMGEDIRSTARIFWPISVKQKDLKDLHQKSTQPPLEPNQPLPIPLEEMVFWESFKDEYSIDLLEVFKEAKKNQEAIKFEMDERGNCKRADSLDKSRFD